MASISKSGKGAIPAAKSKSAASAIPAASKAKPQTALGAVSPDIAERFVRDASAAAEETLETAGEQIEEMKEVVRQVAEASLDQSRAFFGKLREAADQATLSFEETRAATKQAGIELNQVWLKTVNAHSNAAFDLVQNLSGAHSFTDALGIYGEYTRKELEALALGGQEIAEAMQAYGREAGKSFTGVYSRGLTL